MLGSSVMAEQLQADVLQASLWGLHIVDLTLDDSLLNEEQLSGKLVWALAGLAPTLTALHGLPLGELEVSQPMGLAAFARLRTLTLRQLPDQREVVCATLLPLSLVELRLEISYPCETEPELPLLSSFGRLHRLRRLIFA